MKSFSAILLFLSFSCVFSCDKIASRKESFVKKSKAKTKYLVDKTWRKSIDIIWKESATISTCTFEDILGKVTSLQIKNIEGKKIEFLGGFQSYFLKYAGNKVDIINYLNSIESTHPEISDVKAEISDEEELNQKLQFIKEKNSNLYSQIQFFTKFQDENNLECYRISKYPYSHFLVFNKDNQTVYHLVENYQD